MPASLDDDINRLWSETRRLNAETAKLMAEEHKLAAEELRLQRQYPLTYWVQIILAVGAGAGLASVLDLLIGR